MPGWLWVPASIAAANLTACSLIAPAFADRDSGLEAGLTSRCTLERMQQRKELPLRPQSSGIAYAFVVRTQSAGATDRVVRSAGTVYLRTRAEPESYAGVSRDALGHAGEAVVAHEQRLESAQPWTLTALDVLGRPRRDTVIRDGATIRLQTANTARYLSIDEHRRVLTTAKRSEPGSELVIYKADVPDASFPGTCDAVIRDGDYVLLRERYPDAWLGVNHAGAFVAGQEAAAADRASRSQRAAVRICVDETQSCYQDDAGRLYCAWVPACAGTSGPQRSPNKADAAGR